MRWLSILVPLLLPTVAYLIWVRARNLQAQAAGTTDIVPLTKGPWFFLVLGGLLLAIVSLGLLAAFGERCPSGKYVPTRVENNRIIPAHCAPAE